MSIPLCYFVQGIQAYQAPWLAFAVHHLPFTSDCHCMSIVIVTQATRRGGWQGEADWDRDREEEKQRKRRQIPKAMRCSMKLNESEFFIIFLCVVFFHADYLYFSHLNLLFFSLFFLHFTRQDTNKTKAKNEKRNAINCNSEYHKFQRNNRDCTAIANWFQLSIRPRSIHNFNMYKIYR